MTLPTGVRPRSLAERPALARLLREAPEVVGVSGDDGWACAALRVAGRRPVWLGPADPGRAAALLDRLGLGSLSSWADLPFEHAVGPELTLRRDRPGPAPESGSAPLDRVGGALVSILICTFDRAALLREALASALAQRWPCEVLVVDDGSQDETPALLERTEGIRAFRQENAGKPAALARGLAEARGQAVLVLDDDDLLLPGALHLLGRALETHPALALAMGDTVIFGSDGDVQDYLPCATLPGALSRPLALQQIPAMPCATLVRMEAQRAAGPYEPGMVRGQDMDMLLRLSGQGPFEGLPFPVARYRSHDGARGSAAARWHKHRDPAEHRRRFLSFAQPVFARRWRELAPAAGRREGFAWAAGLQARELPGEARAELARWPAPYSPAEAWVRDQAGMPSEVARPAEALVVVDDGDPGALEETLLRHAEGRALWVCLEVPREPLSSIRLFWQGSYGARERLHRWVRHAGPVHLRLSSAPSWAPPPIADLGLLPDLPAPDALRALAAALGWSRPDAERPGLDAAPAPLARAAMAVQELLEQGRPAEAVALASRILAAAPGWRGALLLAARCFESLGREAEAALCRRRARADGTPEG